MDTIKFYIPFEGFYCSIYDDVIEDIISSEINEGYILNDDDIKYNLIYNEISQHIFDVILEFFNDEFELFTDNDYIKYDGLYSPKYYNYGTNKIKAVIEYNNYSKIYGKFILDDNFINFVNESSKSRDGFTSFYNGIDEVSKEPSIFLEYLFKFIVLNKYRDDIIELTCNNLYEIIYNNI